LPSTPQLQGDEFSHGLAHAKDYIGYQKEYHIFGSRIVPFVTPKRRFHVRYGSGADIEA
jgi:hypothetical protein